MDRSLATLAGPAPPEDGRRFEGSVRSLPGSDRTLRSALFRLGADCCGLCTLWHGLRGLALEPILKFASDINAGVRRFIDSV